MCGVILPTTRLGTASKLTAVRGAKVAAGAGHTRGRPGHGVGLAQRHGHGHGDTCGGRSARRHGQRRRDNGGARVRRGHGHGHGHGGIVKVSRVVVSCGRGDGTGGRGHNVCVVLFYQQLG